MKLRLQAEIQQAKAEKEEATRATREAAAIRQKEAGVFAEDSAEEAKTIAAVNSAVKAMATGVGTEAAMLLQAPELKKLRELARGRLQMDESDRKEILAFLENDSHLAPAHGEVISILKQMAEQMQKDLQKKKEQEGRSVKAFQIMQAAKQTELSALTGSIESKLAKVGEIGVEIVQLKQDLSNTAGVLAQDRRFLMDLQESCKKRASSHSEHALALNEELTVLAETIKLLSSANAERMFQKTLKSQALSFLQVTAAAERKQKALEELEAFQRSHKVADVVQMDLLTLALKAKKVSLEKVVEMIDRMAGNLQAAQAADDKKRSLCKDQLRAGASKTADLTQLAQDRETALASEESKLKAIKEELQGLEEGIKDLDKDVAGATAQRQAENEAFKDLVLANRQAIDLLQVAKKRLRTFYGPGQESFIQATEQSLAATEDFAALDSTPAPDSSTVLNMLDTVIAALKKQNAKAVAEEAEAQKVYEKLLKDSSSRRGTNTKLLAQKSSAKAAAEQSYEELKGFESSTQKELSASKQMDSTLHSECDLLAQNYAARQGERQSQVESLSRAKATLGGAKLSFSQVKAHGFLSREM